MVTELDSKIAFKWGEKGALPFAELVIRAPLETCHAKPTLSVPSPSCGCDGRPTHIGLPGGRRHEEADAREADDYDSPRVALC